MTLAIYKSKGISFTDAEKLKRSVGLALDSGNTSPTSSVVDYLFYETGRVLADYTKEYSRLISKVVLTGGGSLPKGVKELAEAKFEQEVVWADPFKKLQAPAFLADILREAGPEFAVAVGLAIHELGEV